MAGDIIDEEVELRLIDTRQLVEEAKKLKEAKRIADEAKKIKPQLSFSQAPFTAPEQAIPKSQQKAQTRTGAIKGQNTFSAFTAMQKKIKLLEKNQKKNKKETDNFRSELFDKLAIGNNVISGTDIPGAVTSVATKFGPIGIAVAAIISAVLPSFFKQLERGGIFSTKLPITQQEKTINDIGFVVDVASGTKFLTSDLRISQKTVDTSNTQNLRYEHIRFVAQENGK